MTDAELLLAEVEALCRVLTATWLAGHHAGNADATRQLRATIFDKHNAAIRRLVELADQPPP